MADQEPNRRVELKRMEVEKDGMKLRYQQQELRLLEIDDEKERIKDNMEATKKEISNIIFFVIVKISGLVLYIL